MKNGPYLLSDWENTLKQENVVTLVFWWLVLQHAFMGDWRG